MHHRFKSRRTFSTRTSGAKGALAVAFVWAAILVAAPATALEKGNNQNKVGRGEVKRACDGAANWLIEQHDLKTGLFGKGKHAAQPGLVAIVVKALCDSPRKYREALGPFVSEPVQYLLKHQQKDGSVLLNDDKGRGTYNTALAILALEATRNPKHAKAIAQARAYLRTCQAADGGFSYGGGKHPTGDLSNTWLAVAALHAAGATKENEADVFKKAAAFVRTCQDHPETNPDPKAKKGPGSGGAHYQPGKSEFGTIKSRGGQEWPRPYASMTAAALESFLLCGLKSDAPEVAAALKWFRKNVSSGVSENKGGGQRGYFYFCMGFSRAMQRAGVKEWKGPDGNVVRWAEALAGELLKKQKPEGWFRNEDPHWLEDDPVLCTGYALQALNHCYQVLGK